MRPVRSHASRWSHAKGLWALFWRMLLLTPIVAVFGTVAYITVLGLSIFPPFLAVVLIINADYWWAVLAVAVWLAWLRFGGPVRRFVFEGFEHGSL